MNFDQKMLRLKQCLNVTTDKEAAAAIGLSKTALAERKRRDAFPEKNVREAARDSPDLGIDVLYVLTGEREYPHPESQDQFIARMRALKRGEEEGAAGGVALLAGEIPSSQAITYPASGTAAGLLAAEKPGLSHQEVLMLVLDALHAEGRTLPAAKIMAAVDGILAWQRAGIHVTESSVAKQLRQVKA